MVFKLEPIELGYLSLVLSLKVKVTGNDYLVPVRWFEVKVIQSVSHLWTSDSSRGRSHISSIRDYTVILKLHMFSHISDRFFGFDSPIELCYLNFYVAFCQI